MTRTNPASQGVTHRKDGLFQAAATVEGRRIFAYGKSEREALARLKTARDRAIKAGGVASGERFGQLVALWLDRLQVRDKTVQNYTAECAILTHLFGKTTRLKAITPARIEAALGAYRDRPRTRQLLYLRLKQLFATAVRLGWLPADPMLRVSRPKHHYHRQDVWTADQTAAFLAGAGRWRSLWLLLIGAGIRIGEARALQWRDLDLDAGMVRIERTVQRVNKQETIGEPKTRAGIRAVTIPPQAVAALIEHRAEQQRDLARLGVDNPDGWLWLTDSGRHATYRTIDAAWQRDIDRAGLSGTPHLLRHVHASILLAGGMPVPEVARRLGHATPAVTLAVYAHALPGLDRGGEIASRFLPDAPALPAPEMPAVEETTR